MEDQKIAPPRSLATAVLSNPLSALLAALAALAVLAPLLWLSLRKQTYHLRMSAGDVKGQRHRMAMAMASLARREGVFLTITETEGSAAMRSMMQGSQLDLALVQGGLGDAEGLTQVAALTVEPLHLLVRKELLDKGFDGLRGKLLNLSTQKSGTRVLAREVLEFAELRHGIDYRDSDLPYSKLIEMPKEKLPDGIFTVSLLPSPIANDLVERCDYVLMPIPFAAALGLRDYGVRSVTIPKYAYSVSPPIPADDIETVGTNLLLMARKDVPDEAVKRLLTVLLDVRFARAAGTTPIEESAIASQPELPLHTGTDAFLRRNDPAITSDFLQGVDSFRNLVVSALLAGFFGWQWLRKRNLNTFDRYFDAVTRVEKDALALESTAPLDTDALVTLRQRLGEIKSEALNEFTEGRLSGEEMMNGFLAHVADARSHLDALILHTRRESSGTTEKQAGNITDAGRTK